MDSEAEETVRFISAPPSAATHGQPDVDEKEFKSQRIRTVTLINLAGMMERMDEQVRSKKQSKFAPIHGALVLAAHAYEFCADTASAVQRSRESL